MKKSLILFVLACLLLSPLSPASAATTKAYNDRSLIYLTFDDGPHRQTGALLDVLRKHKVKATFFILGNNIKGNEKLLKRIVAEGHLIALHGMTHDRHKFYRTPTTAVREMQTVQKLVFQVTGVKSNIVRTPYGSNPYMTSAHRQAMAKAGFQMWDWNADSLDWRYKSDNRRVQNQVFARLNANYKANIASIVLVHDHSITPATLDYIIRHSKKRGYEFRTLQGIKTPHNFFNKWKPKQ
ncbi:polysaccharide deacetylase family protein [Exiguobacterium sp. SH3S1]|uniref:polysaccharide deacetylase family protein n=1 Tax=Exiguobacterium sp. SH3S1 TaxID=2510955 RepID=UPI00103B2A6F|nr:polysaccharide deacetylase family protein [Exiguobacterium sp. SH3S1]TCI60793.1 polysaccharide deacetylase [Exiguobacterium sp. SH3S1]